jgi:hypothetical protein
MIQAAGNDQCGKYRWQLLLLLLPGQVRLQETEAVPCC